MSDTKNCEYCGVLIVRGAGRCQQAWSHLKFCGRVCNQKSTWERVKVRKYGDVPDHKRKRRVTEDEARQYADLIKSGLSPHAAAKQAGRTDYTAIQSKAVALGFMPAPKPKSPPVVQPAPEPPRKITRIDPLPSGSAETWGVMMPGISWEKARSDTWGMRL